jgi:hypothetical protein
VLGFTRDFLGSVQHADQVVRELAADGADLCQRFPDSALDLLDLIVDTSTPRRPRELDTCLDAFESAKPSLSSDPRTIRVRDYWRGGM